MKSLHFLKIAFLILTLAIGNAAEKIQISVDTTKPGPAISPQMWGLFFEDINFGADGGLYAELVKNRGFEFPQSLAGWHKIGAGPDHVKLSTNAPFETTANARYVLLQSSGSEPVGIENEGFRGMGVLQGKTYNFTTQARAFAGKPYLRVELVSESGKLLAAKRVLGAGATWGRLSTRLVPNATDPKARLRVLVEGGGTLGLDMVSLFPVNTWQNRPGGLRSDLVQMLADMQPGFLRFPGGCIVEGSTLDRRYQWKQTVGPIEGRQLLINRWNYEFKHRPAPDYFQSFGLGFYEYFLLCEDIGAEPVPILNCGMACQFNSGELAPMESLDTYIQDALDLIEFANGPKSSKWGALRASMGHPKPFKMKLLGIGNEQWGPQYLERYAAFAQVLKDKHPEITVISSSGPAPSDPRFHYLWPKLKELPAQIVDEHCYANPIWFYANSDRYNDYDRSGPKVFMGEYAAQSVAIANQANRNTLECALAEAAFMTGMERNADLVVMASYAPLLAHVDAWQWTPNMIWADNLRNYGTPSYYVQKLFSLNRGDRVLSAKLNTPQPLPAGRIGLGTYQTSAEFRGVKVTRGTEVLVGPDQAALNWITEGGTWDANSGLLRQTQADAVGWAMGGSTNWSNYTVSLQARKIAGKEGFMIRVLDGGNNSWVTWNIGGWNNRQHAIQVNLGGQETLLAPVPGSVEPDHWYDIRVELQGTTMVCYLEGQLIHQVEVPRNQVQRLYVTAARDDSENEVIVKVVNPFESTDANLDLSGMRRDERSIRAFVLAGDDLDGQNSLNDPTRLAPVTSRARVSLPRFDYKFPAHSVTVLRIKAP